MKILIIWFLFLTIWLQHGETNTTGSFEIPYSQRYHLQTQCPPFDRIWCGNMPSYQKQKSVLVDHKVSLPYNLSSKQERSVSQKFGISRVDPERIWKIFFFLFREWRETDELFLWRFFVLQSELKWREREMRTTKVCDHMVPKRSQIQNSESIPIDLIPSRVSSLQIVKETLDWGFG